MLFFLRWSVIGRLRSPSESTMLQRMALRKTVDSHISSPFFIAYGVKYKVQDVPMHLYMDIYYIYGSVLLIYSGSNHSSQVLLCSLVSKAPTLYRPGDAQKPTRILIL